MKRFILAAALLTLGLASCKKDYECECTSTFSGNGQLFMDSQTEITTINATQTKAAEKCEDLESTTTTNGLERAVECEIK